MNLADRFRQTWVLILERCAKKVDEKEFQLQQMTHHDETAYHVSSPQDHHI